MRPVRHESLLIQRRHRASDMRRAPLVVEVEYIITTCNKLSGGGQRLLTAPAWTIMLCLELLQAASLLQPGLEDLPLFPPTATPLPLQGE